MTLIPSDLVVEPVVVTTAETPVVDTKRTVVGATLTSRETKSLPLATRSVLDLIFTASGRHRRATVHARPRRRSQQQSRQHARRGRHFFARRCTGLFEQPDDRRPRQQRRSRRTRTFPAVARSGRGSSGDHESVFGGVWPRIGRARKFADAQRFAAVSRKRVLLLSETKRSTQTRFATTRSGSRACRCRNTSRGFTLGGPSAASQTSGFLRLIRAEQNTRQRPHRHARSADRKRAFIPYLRQLIRTQPA